MERDLVSTLPHSHGDGMQLGGFAMCFRLPVQCRFDAWSASANQLLGWPRQLGELAVSCERVPQSMRATCSPRLAGPTSRRSPPSLAMPVDGRGSSHVPSERRKAG